MFVGGISEILKWECGFCYILLESSLQDENFNKNSFFLQWLLKELLVDSGLKRKNQTGQKKSDWCTQHGGSLRGLQHKTSNGKEVLVTYLCKNQWKL